MKRFTHSVILSDLLSSHFHKLIAWHGKLHLHMVVLTVCKFFFFFCNTFYLYRRISLIFPAHLEAADNVVSTVYYVSYLCSQTHLIYFNSTLCNFSTLCFYSVRFYGLIGFV